MEVSSVQHATGSRTEHAASASPSGVLSLPSPAYASPATAAAAAVATAAARGRPSSSTTAESMSSGRRYVSPGTPTPVPTADDAIAAAVVSTRHAAGNSVLGQEGYAAHGGNAARGGMVHHPPNIVTAASPASISSPMQLQVGMQPPPSRAGFLPGSASALVRTPAGEGEGGAVIGLTSVGATPRQGSVSSRFRERQQTAAVSASSSSSVSSSARAAYADAEGAGSVHDAAARSGQPYVNDPRPSLRTMLSPPVDASSSAVSVHHLPPASGVDSRRPAASLLSAPGLGSAAYAAPAAATPTSHYAGLPASEHADAPFRTPPAGSSSLAPVASVGIAGIATGRALPPLQARTASGFAQHNASAALTGAPSSMFSPPLAPGSTRHAGNIAAAASPAGSATSGSAPSLTSTPSGTRPFSAGMLPQLVRVSATHRALGSAAYAGTPVTSGGGGGGTSLTYMQATPKSEPAGRLELRMLSPSSVGGTPHAAALQSGGQTTTGFLTPVARIGVRRVSRRLRGDAAAGDTAASGGMWMDTPGSVSAARRPWTVGHTLEAEEVATEVARAGGYDGVGAGGILR
ncbi:hypothetical protein EON68_01500, partial [archaeon]